VYGFSEQNIYGLRYEGPSAEGIKLKSLANILSKRKVIYSDLFENTAGGELALADLVGPIQRQRFFAKNATSKQIMTGNIGVDFTHPIYDSSFTVLRVGVDKDNRRELLLQSIGHLNPDLHILHLSFKSQRSDRFLALFPDLEVSKPTAFLCDSSNKLQLFLYLKAIKIVLQQASEQGRRVLLIIDDINDLFHKLFNFYHYSRNDVRSRGAPSVHSRYL